MKQKQPNAERTIQVDGSEFIEEHTETPEPSAPEKKSEVSDDKHDDLAIEDHATMLFPGMVS